MSWLQLLILAIIQGLTEFLPVSSSAHLILPAALLHWPDQGPLIDLMAHFGSLFAVMLYFHRDVARILTGLGDLLRRRQSQAAQLAVLLIVSTPPVLILGLFLNMGGFDIMLRQPVIIALAFIIFGLILWWADKNGAQNKSMDAMTWRGAAMIGAAQALALIPGTSRSGITMTAALKLGFNRTEAARFSMLMSMPIIGVSGVFALYKLHSGGAGLANLTDGLIVAGFSFIAAYAAIAVFMKLVERIGMFPFMLYRVVAGVGLLVAIAMGVI